MPADPYLGQIMPAGFGVIPKGWALCNGALMQISTNQALFTLLGTTYGGNGFQNFALPDLRGRAVLGCNFGSVPWGQVAGTENVTLNLAQLASHAHNIMATTASGSGSRGGSSPSNNLFGTNTMGTPLETIFAMPGSMEVQLSTGTNIGNTGGGGPHNNMQPTQVINYLIAIQGIYPSRP